MEFKGHLAVAGMRRAETLADKISLEYGGKTSSAIVFTLLDTSMPPNVGAVE